MALRTSLARPSTELASRLTLPILAETSLAAAADSATERLISVVAACCSSIAAATEDCDLVDFRNLAADAPRPLPRSPAVAFCTSAISREISSVDFAVWSDSDFTSAATTAKPRPASPARAASIVALSASRLVCSAMPPIRLETSAILLTAFDSDWMVLLAFSRPADRGLGDGAGARDLRGDLADRARSSVRPRRKPFARWRAPARSVGDRLRLGRQVARQTRQARRRHSRRRARPGRGFDRCRRFRARRTRPCRATACRLCSSVCALVLLLLLAQPRHCRRALVLEDRKRAAPSRRSRRLAIRQTGPRSQIAAARSAASHRSCAPADARRRAQDQAGPARRSRSTRPETRPDHV